MSMLADVTRRIQLDRGPHSILADNLCDLADREAEFSARVARRFGERAGSVVHECRQIARAATQCAVELRSQFG